MSSARHISAIMRQVYLIATSETVSPHMSPVLAMATPKQNALLTLLFSPWTISHGSPRAIAADNNAAGGLRGYS